MKKSVFAYAAVTALAIVSVTAGMQSFTRAATPSPSTTFPSLTTIYVGSGVYDNGGATNAGVATATHCSNVSGVSVQVRVLILHNAGGVAGSFTQTLQHGATSTVSTHPTTIFVDPGLATGTIQQGLVNVEATNSAVFCTAAVIDAAANPPVFSMPLHLVRVNPHPGTEE